MLTQTALQDFSTVQLSICERQFFFDVQYKWKTKSFKLHRTTKVTRGY